MERGDRPLLQTRPQVDQQVSATDEIHPREGRIGEQVLPCEDDHLTHRLVDAVAPLLLDKEPPQTFGADVVHETLGVQREPSFAQQRFIEVGGEHLQVAPARRILGHLHERDGDGIRFLPAGTAQHPNANRFVVGLFQQVGQNLALKSLERFGVAEETRHADQHVGAKRIEFGGVASQKLGVVLDRVLLVDHQPPSNATLNRRGFVEREVHAGMIPQQRQRLRVAVFRRRNDISITERHGASRR